MPAVIDLDRHTGGRARAELPIEQVIHHFPVDDRQDGMQLPDRFIGNAHRVKVVVAQYHDIPELASSIEPSLFSS